jgi:HNH endonuclease
MLEHRFVMQNHLGRPLLRTETVHHKDGNRANNAIENLELKAGNHGKGIDARDHVQASIDAITHYVALDLVDLAALATIRKKASRDR